MENINKELSEDIQLLSKFGKLLSHPVRINIITMIAQSGNKLLENKLSVLDVAPNALEKHLDDLMNIGLVSIRKNEKKELYYYLEVEVYGQFRELFEKFFNTAWGMIYNRNINSNNNEADKLQNSKVQKEAISDKDLLSFIKST